MHWYKLKDDEVERILSCIIVCYILELEYIYIGHIAKRRTSPVFALNKQNVTKHSPYLVQYLVVFCILKAKTVLACLLDIVQYRCISI